MAVKEFTRAFMATDGRVFLERSDAEQHEIKELMRRAIRQASADARHDKFGRTSAYCYPDRLLEEMLKAGFTLKESA